MEIISAILRALGINQRHSAKISDRKAEALRLNAETIGLLGKLIDHINFELMRLGHRDMSLLPDLPELWEEGRAPIASHIFELERGMRLLEEDKSKISAGNTYSMRKWDEVVAIQADKKIAMEREDVRVRQLLAQVDRIFDQVEAMTPDERAEEVEALRENLPPR